MKPVKQHKADDLFYSLKAALRAAQNIYIEELEKPSTDVTRYDNQKSHQALQLITSIRDAVDAANKYRKDE